MKKLIFLLVLIGIAFGQVRVQEMPRAKTPRAKDYFFLTQDTTGLGGLNYKSRKITFDSLRAALGYKSYRSNATNGSLIVGISSRIDSIISTVRTDILYDKYGNPILDEISDTLSSVDYATLFKYEVVGGLNESRLYDGDILEAVVIRPPLPPLQNYRIVTINAEVYYSYGDKVAVKYQSTDTLMKGDIFIKVGNTKYTNRQKLIYMTSDGQNSPYIAMWDSISTYNIWANRLKPKLIIGNLNGFTDPLFPEMEGYGLRASNVYLDGDIIIRNPEDISGVPFDNLTGIPAPLGNVSSAGLYLNASYMGYYSGSSWRTYMDNVGNFYLSHPSNHSLSWTSSTGTLSIKGSINIVNPTTAFNGTKLNTTDLNNDAGWSAGSNVTKSTTAPSTPKANDFWYDTSTGNAILKYYTGSVWSEVGANGVYISGDGLYAGTVGAQQIIAGTGFINNLNVYSTFTLGDGTSDGYIQSYGWNGTANGFQIKGGATPSLTLIGGSYKGGLFETPSGSKFGTDVSSTNDGLYINSSNYILDNNSFKIGGDQGITYTGSGGIINLGSSINLVGSVFQSGSLTGSLELGTSGKVITSTNATRFELNDNGLYGYNNNNIRAFISNDGSGYFGGSDKFWWGTDGTTNMKNVTVSSESGSNELRLTGASVDIYQSGNLYGYFRPDNIYMRNATYAFSYGAGIQGVSVLSTNKKAEINMTSSTQFGLNVTDGTNSSLVTELYMSTNGYVNGGSYKVGGVTQKLVTSISSGTASGLYVANSSGGLATTQLNKKTITFSDGSTMDVLVP